ncbi:MAG: hypothetical protein ACRD29_13690 [Acidimicrobiales bacterium]
MPATMDEGADPLEPALETIAAAAREGIALRLLGGLAVRYLCPSFPPRTRHQQDVDLASVSSARRNLARFLSERGFVPDREFNALYGAKQMYFGSPDRAWALDVIIDRLHMCHVLEFRDRIERMPHTLDLTDLLLSKLQIVEVNEKDLQDALYLLAAFPVRESDEPGTIDPVRLCEVVGEDWGWWRTVTGNLERIAALGPDDRERLVPPHARFDPIEQARSLHRLADEAPKSLRWRLRAVVGERLRWYNVPEEVAHR